MSKPITRRLFARQAAVAPLAADAALQQQAQIVGIVGGQSFGMPAVAANGSQERAWSKAAWASMFTMCPAPGTTARWALGMRAAITSAARW